MPVLLVLLFVVVPLAELYVLIQVGQVIGAWWTILILLADSILGSLLLRSQGRSAWGRFRAATQEGRIPHREVFDGALIVFGGALLLTPGFLTDVLGLLLLFPPTRAIVRGALARLVSSRIVAGVAGPGGAVAYEGGRALWRRRGTGSGARGTEGAHRTEGSGAPDVDGTARAPRAPDVDGTAREREPGGTPRPPR